MIKNKDCKKIDLCKLALFLFLISSFLQLCLATPEIKGKLVQDQTLEIIKVHDHLKCSQNNQQPQDYLPESKEFTIIFGIARLFKYSAKNSMSEIKHPIVDNLIVIFKFLDESLTDIKQVTNAVKELNNILYKETDNLCVHETEVYTYFFRLLLKLGEFLIDSSENDLFNTFVTNPFLNENFILEKFHLKDQQPQTFINHLRFIDSTDLLSQKTSQKNVFKSKYMYNSLYPKYLYFIVHKDSRKLFECINFNRKYLFRYTDQNKVCFYQLVGFLNEEEGKVYSYLNENNEWRRYINNKQVKFNKSTPCPTVVMFEKYAEYRINLSEKI
ncbi:hypothetical protein TUBRATIS_24730 [Tubulinosema ratisbonensis]|uniref:Uncharacterized protein n=1 Tax=Tubulinosema ratisbonensis TaxID=291195 RepID=A0A437AIU7_9MICR|nr:hypothetical protein TUBRATIS_24730 [Tubulinosema ratisbonensis]